MDNGKRQSAIPLCLPRFYRWDSQIGECIIETGNQSSELYVIEEALGQLRDIKGPVCVVSIYGQCRNGKSYLLSEVFGQRGVFPVGHDSIPKTRGIWLWIAPEKYKDASGQEFSVLLLDSEGFDQVCSESYSEQIFTLTVLLSSVLIYNSTGIPDRSDLHRMEFIERLSRRIQHKSITEAGSYFNEPVLLQKTFPRFLWLLRDVPQAFRWDCRGVKDYILQEVFKRRKISSVFSDESNLVAEAILDFSPDFDAFALPPPASDLEMMRKFDTDGHKLNPMFPSCLQLFKILLQNKLEAKRSVIEGERLTGKGLAALVQTYAETLNKRGATVILHCAWREAQNLRQSNEIGYGGHSRGPKELDQRNVKLKKENAQLKNRKEDQANKLSSSTKLNGTSGQTLALRNGVVTSIQSEACEPKEFVSRFQKILQLDPASLADPDPETKRWIRCHAIQAKTENRTEVVKYLRKFVPAGTTGPLLNENLDVRDVPLLQKKELTHSLSGGEEWKLLAEKLGFSNIDIRFLDKRVVNPSDTALDAIGNQRFLSVGEVYDMLVDCGLPTIADIL